MSETGLSSEADGMDNVHPLGVVTSAASQPGIEELSIDDVKKNITFSDSITDAVKDIVPPIRDISILSVLQDPENVILHKAFLRLKEEFTENRALSELNKMYDLYRSSVSENSLLAAHCRELQEKVKQYEARHQWDPRVLKVLLIAERYRHEKALVYDEKNEIEAELIDMAMEKKHLEDNLKNKNKDLLKCQDELKKAKELEKQVENLEILVMKKDNQIHHIKESHDALTQPQAHNKQDSPRRVSIASAGARFSMIERDYIAKIDHIKADKDVTKNELDEKTNALKFLNRKITRINHEKNDLSKITKEQLKTISKQASEFKKLQNKYAALEKQMENIKAQLNLTKSELVAANVHLDGSIQENKHANNLMSIMQQQKIACRRNYGNTLRELALAREEKQGAISERKAMFQEGLSCQKEVAKAQASTKEKSRDYDQLVNRLYKVEAARKHYLELMKVTKTNQSAMIKEIATLRENLQVEKAHVAKDEVAMLRMQCQIEGLQKEYLSILERNILMVRNHEISIAAIEQYEQLKAVDARRITQLMKTNIDLYTQTTSQQEIGLIQSHQFHLKENEIKGLLFRLEEEHHKMEMIVCKDNEKRGIIEHLHAEATVREDKIKFLKSTIESNNQLNKSLSDKVEELTDQLKLTSTQKDLVRRQRDLFGTKLLQSKVETQLCQDTLRTARDTLTRHSVDFYNTQNDIRVLKLEIKDLRRKNKLSEGHADMILTLQQELGQSCKALELQKCKNTILEKTKMPQPHRWRSLQASDPTRYEMVLKINLITRRLIEKTKEVARLEELLKQKDTMYLSLRVLVQRRMNTQLSSEMMGAKKVIQKQSRQLKALTAELNMANYDVTECNTREQETKKSMNKAVLQQAREKVAKFSKTNKKDVSHFPLLPTLPAIHHEQSS